jgi:hypothetical protein
VRDFFQPIARKWRRLSVAADTAYHEGDSVEAMSKLRIEPHLPAWQNRKHPDWVGERLRATPRYQRSRRCRQWIECCFAWFKGPAGLRQTVFRGTQRVAWKLCFAAGAYNLVRMLRLAPQP